MAWYKDLTECDYFGKENARNLRAIGWIESGKSFPTGEIDAEVFQRLLEFGKNPWFSSWTTFRGYHVCEICEFEKGMLNLFIPTKGFLYVCPILIIHYINIHRYLPPDEFCKAVLACPPMDSIEYKQALIKNGGRTLTEDYFS